MKQIIYRKYFIKIVSRDTRNPKQNKNNIRHLKKGSVIPLPSKYKIQMVSY